MSEKPEFKQIGEDYRYTWPDFGIAIELSRFHEERSGLTTEITVLEVSESESPRLLHSARFNLASSTTRKSLVDILGKRLDTIDWYGIFEQLCFMARERYRHGEPPIDLRTVEPYATPRWFLYPYMPVEGTTLLAAHGGSGKSVIALAMAFSMASGRAFVGKPMAEPKPVLYLDYETGPQTHASRLTAITAGAGATELPPIHYRAMAASLPEAAPAVRRDIDSLGIGMVVVDSLGAAGAGPPEEAGTAIPLFNAMRSLRVPVLAIHHRPKEQAGQRSNDSIFGSVYHVNLARMVWIATAKTSESAESTILVSLRNTKSNDGRLVNGHVLRIQFENNSADQLMAVNVQRHEMADNPETATDAPLRDRVMHELEHGGAAVKQLSDKLDVAESKVSVTLTRLKERGLVVQLPQQRWALKAVQEVD